MIAILEGRLLPHQEDSVVILHAAGVGYQVFVGPQLVAKASSEVGEIRLHTSMVVRETAMTLYGFESLEEKMLFDRMLSVRGVGPRIGMALLSALSVDGLRQAIDQGDTARLASVPGLGKKGSERIYLELQGKIAPPSKGEKVPFATTHNDELASALNNLGFKELDILNALQKVPPNAGSIEERIQAALGVLKRH